MTTYFYHITGNDFAGASDANADSYMTKSATLRASDSSAKQISYYTGTEPGEEQIDWSQEYNYNGTLVKTTTVYTHDTAGALTESVVFKDSKAGHPYLKEERDLLPGRERRREGRLHE